MTPGNTPLDFGAYRNKMEAHFKKMATIFSEGELDEQGIPSYTHSNRLMAWLFWKKNHIAMDYLHALAPIDKVLDFGCGAGPLFMFCEEYANQTLAFDVNLKPAQFTLANFPFKKIRLLENSKELESLPDASFDVIIALEVLEHVDDLKSTGILFHRLLKPGGRVIVSGPTESYFYRLGRWAAGYKQHFHVRNIYDIEKVLSEFFGFDLIAELYPPIVIYRVSTFTKISE